MSPKLWVWAIRYSGLLAIGAIVLGFSIALPGLFFTETTLRTVIANVAIVGILALAMLIPLAAGLIDLSFASVAGLSLIVTVQLSIDSGLPLWLIIVIAFGAASVVGLLNGLLVAMLRLDALIVTLGTSTVVVGISALLTGGSTLYGKFPKGFVQIGQGSVGAIPYLTLVLVVLAVVIWVWLEHTPAGRYTLAAGSNPVAAKLAGISLIKTQMLSLLASSIVAGLAGVLMAAQLGSGSTTTGPGFLLPVVAALFLGETQVRERPNVVGTMIAIFVLGTGIKGLQLIGAEAWVTDVYNGSVLLLAVALAAVRRRGAAVGS